MTSARSAIAAAMPSDRRGFLSHLAALPLIGGGLSLVGRPTAVAEPVTPDLIEAYKTWLDLESRHLIWDMAADPLFIERYRLHPGNDETRNGRADVISRMLSFVGRSGSYHSPRRPSAYTRAALVLSAVGCDWHEDEQLERRA